MAANCLSTLKYDVIFIGESHDLKALAWFRVVFFISLSTLDKISS